MRTAFTNGWVSRSSKIWELISTWSGGRKSEIVALRVMRSVPPAVAGGSLDCLASRYPPATAGGTDLLFLEVVKDGLVAMTLLAAGNRHQKDFELTHLLMLERVEALGQTSMSRTIKENREAFHSAVLVGLRQVARNRGQLQLELLVVELKLELRMNVSGEFFLSQFSRHQSIPQDQ